MAAQENTSINNLAEMSTGDIYDMITRRISQARGIADCLGNLDADGGSLDDHSENSATWAIKDLLDQANEYLDALLRRTKQQEGGAA